MRAMIYARSDIQGDEGTASLKEQTRRCLEWIDDNGKDYGWTKAGVFVDTASGRSGWTERPGLSIIRELARSGSIGGIIMAHSDILSTDRDYLPDFLDEFSERGITLVFIGPHGSEPTIIRRAGEQHL